MVLLRINHLSMPPEIVEELAVVLDNEVRPDSVERARRHVCDLSWEDGRVAWEIAGQLLLLSMPA